MKVRELIERSVAEWLERHPPDVIEQLVAESIDNELRGSIVDLIGVKTWNKGDVDIRWNGLAVREIRNIAADKVREWIVQNITTLPEMSDKLKLAMIQEYKDQYESCLKEEMWELARDNAARDADILVTGMLSDINPLDVEYEDEDSSNDSVSDNWK